MASTDGQVIEKILGSKEFQDSKMYKKLLQYLFECYSNNIVPKESVIAIDVFNSHSADDLNVLTKVRVYIHNLRKKIDSYYRNEGINDPVKIDIPKGKYTLLFKKENDRIFRKNNIIMSSTVLLLILIILALFVTIYLLYRKSNLSYEVENLRTWNEFFNNEYSTLIIIGDYYVYMDTLPSGRTGLIRDLRINSDEELETMLHEIPEKRKTIQRTNHTFITKLAPWGVSKIAPILSGNNAVYNLKLSSNLQWQDLKNFNLIYIGSYKSLSLLNSFFKQSSFDYVINEDLLLLKQENGEIKQFKTSRNIKPGIMKDYAVVIKTVGSENNSILMFLSTHDIGDLATIDYFTKIEELKEFEKNNFVAKNVSNFEALFEVSGFEKTNFELELLYFKETE